MAERVTGTVVNWDSFLGIGFIERDFYEGYECHIFVEANAVRKGCSFKLKQGLRVEFIITQHGIKGPQAEDVTLEE